MFFSEYFLKLSGHSHGAGHVLLADKVGNFAAQTTRQGNETFVVLFENFLIHPWLIIKSFEVCFTD